MRNFILYATTLYFVCLTFVYAHTKPTPDTELQQYYFAAARLGDVKLMQAFIAAGVSPNHANVKGYTPIMIATYHGQSIMVDYLLDHGANACAKDNRGNTALMAAIFRTELSIAKKLMSQSCDPNHQNNAGQTPLMYAALFNRTTLIDALKKKGAQIELRDKLGNSAADLATSQGNLALINRLQPAKPN
ncbi:MAG: ankyrin repeat domain-containing protein [Gammaproteobacteria bacterium]|nr:ankyrin repeat domain-containing protein [Gammaproteobacteria bacterium]